MFSVIEAGKGKFIKAWNHGVPFEEKAVEQLKQTARLPFVAPYVAAMPDTHWGLGATVGSVVPTEGAVCPAAVGVDIGCGMIAVRLKLTREAIAGESFRGACGHRTRRALRANASRGRRRCGRVVFAGDSFAYSEAVEGRVRRAVQEIVRASSGGAISKRRAASGHAGDGQSLSGIDYGRRRICSGW